jgi:hypothetical protein
VVEHWTSRVGSGPDAIDAFRAELTVGG